MLNLLLGSMQTILDLLKTADRQFKRIIQINFDIVLMFISLMCAMVLRLETFEFLAQDTFYISFFVIAPPTIYLFYQFGLYRSFILYISQELVVLVTLASICSGVLLVLVKTFFWSELPWTVPIIYFLMLFLLVNSSRFIVRSLFRSNNARGQKSVAIYGAGEAGRQLMQSLRSDSKYNVKIIIDDKKFLQGKKIFGHTIMGFSEAHKKFKKFGIDTVLVCMPSTSFSVRKSIISKLSELSLDVKVVPDLARLLDGASKISEIRDVQLDDLLGRDQVELDANLSNDTISGKTVLVTGAGGSIGSELCRQILRLKPSHLMLVDVSEFAMYTIQQEIEKKAFEQNISTSFFVGSVQDKKLIERVMGENQVDTVFHSAAYKHVPLMEKNYTEVIKNNTIGTYLLGNEAIKTGVSNFTLISTDKAVNPTNIMGASKRLAERICQTNNRMQTQTKFATVRFGNVVGSSGSVVPLFKKQIMSGGPVTLTHSDVTRYFMTISEAVQLVIAATTLSNEGEIFVLDMGEQMKIKDLAFKIIQLSGLKPYMEGETTNEGDIEVREVGLRPGEKLYEELSYKDDLIVSQHQRIMIAQEGALSSEQVNKLMDLLYKFMETGDIVALKEILVKYANFGEAEA